MVILNDASVQQNALGPVRRVALVVLDGVGVGALPDAHHYGDEGAHSVAHAAAAVGGLRVPHLEALGLGRIASIPGVAPHPSPAGAFGRMAERSPGKDTTTGHWEIAGIVLSRPFPTYPNGFPPEVIEPFQGAIGRSVLWNRPASGTEIIQRLGEEHMRTGSPIVYTSADSVFQIAAHVDVIPLEELYAMCEKARAILQGEHGVGRVIARPFTGEPGRFQRTADRRDFSLEPPSPTLLDVLSAQGVPVTSVGKIWDIFAGRGIGHAIPASNNEEAVDGLVAALRNGPADGLIFVNCVDFDTVWGHRRDPHGYAHALERFDQRLPDIQGAMASGDVLMLVGDHGCDPTHPGTDHTREYTPLLVAGDPIIPGVDLGTRSTFADVAATIAAWFGVDNPGPGVSFAADVTVSPGR